jgi:hypothetical protein
MRLATTPVLRQSVGEDATGSAAASFRDQRVIPRQALTSYGPWNILNRHGWDGVHHKALARCLSQFFATKGQLPESPRTVVLLMPPPRAIFARDSSTKREIVRQRDRERERAVEINIKLPRTLLVGIGLNCTNLLNNVYCQTDSTNLHGGASAALNSTEFSQHSVEIQTPRQAGMD